MQTDTLLHFLASANIVFTIGLLSNVWLGLFISAVVGIGWELFWHFKEGKPVSVADLKADGLGILFAVAIMIIGS